MTNIPVGGGGYTVLNSNSGVCNIVHKTDLDTMIDSVCDTMLALAKDHCGLYGDFAILDDPFTSPDKPMFSMDGISIFKSTKFINHIEDTIRRLLVYCASNSDTVAGDGTTSALIISTTAFKEIRKRLSEMPPVAFFQLQEQYDDFFNEYVALNKSTHTEDSIVVMPMSTGVMTVDFIVEKLVKAFSSEQYYNVDKTFVPPSEHVIRQIVVYMVAYSQAITSSHGCKELSRAVAELFSKTPQESWDHVFFGKNIFEKEEYRFSVDYLTDQFIMSAKIMNQSMLNLKIGGKLDFTNATLVPICHEIMVSQMHNFAVLKGMIEDHVVNKKEMLIIHTSTLDNATSATLNSIFETLKDNGHINETVAIVSHEPIMAHLHDVSVLNLVCGKVPMLPTEPFNVIHGVSVKFDQFKLRLNNLYPNPTNSEIHPYYTDNNFPQFADYAAVIEESIANHKLSSQTYTKHDDIMNLDELYHKLKYTRRVTVNIGGLLHGSVASVDVLKDAIYAARSSLRHGFELGSAIGLATKCQIIRDDMNSGCTPFSALKTIFVESFISAVDTLCAIVGMTMWDYGCISGNHCITDVSNNSVCSFDSMINAIFQMIDSQSYSVNMNDELIQLVPKHVLPIQPKMINETVVKRFGDLFMYFLKSSKIITTGGVMLAAEDKTKDGNRSS